MSLRFLRLRLDNFRSFKGSHTLQLDRRPGFYFVAGENIAEPNLGANGAGKTTLFVDALLWCLMGKTARDKRPGDSVDNWKATKGATIVELMVERDGVKHSIYRSRGPNRLRVDDKDVEQHVVTKVVGLSEEAICRTFLIGQFATMFLDLGPQEQSELFTDILNLGVWIRGAETAGKKAREAAKNAETYTGEILGLEGQLRALRTQLDSSSKQHDRWEVDNGEELIGEAAELKWATKALADAEQTMSKSRTRGTGTESKVARLDSLLVVQRKNLKEWEARCAKLAEHCVQQRTDVANAEEALNDLQKSYESNRACSACGQTITPQHYKSERRRIHAERDFDLKTLQGTTKELEDTTRDKEGCVAAVEDLQEQRRAVLAKDSEENAGKLATLRADIRLSRARLEGIEKRKNPHTSYLKDLREDIKECKEGIALKRARFENAARDAETYAYWVDGYKEIRLELIDDALIDLEVASNREAELLGLDGWKIKFATERETKSGSVSQGFTVYLYPPGVQEPVRWAAYSGGENQRLQLAATFGLSDVLLSRAGIEPNIEVLDEPTQRLSTEGIDDLLDSLSSRARDLGRAIFFLDHRSIDRGSFDGVITVSKDKQGSKILE